MMKTSMFQNSNEYGKTISDARKMLYISTFKDIQTKKKLNKYRLFISLKNRKVNKNENKKYK